MTKLPRLYAQSSTGKTLFWDMVVESNRYASTHGQIDGKAVTDEWTEVAGKNIGRSNETTPEEQALFEAKAKWKKKIEQGGYFESVDDIEKETFFSPQLAKGYEDYAEDICWGEPVFVSPKLDGMRCIIKKSGATSRNGKPIVSIPHIIEALNPLFEKDPTLILDGELYCDRLANDFNEIMSLAKQKKPDAEDFARSERDLEYHIFDIPSWRQTFSVRWVLMEQLFKQEIELLSKKYFKLVPHIRIHGAEQLEAYLAKFIEAGYEGAMLNLDTKYENKRSKGLLKYKLFKDEEFDILDISEGDGNRAGMFGRAHLVTRAGVKFDSNARGNHKFYTDLWVNRKKYIGKCAATVRFQNYTPDGVPRFPVIVAIRNYE